MKKHKIVLGITRSGKTYKALKEIKLNKNDINIFIDLKDEVKLGKRITSSNTLRELKYSLEQYKTVTYIPSISENKHIHELNKIIELLMIMKQKYFINLYIDEISDFIPQGTKESKIYEVARRGLNVKNKGVRLVMLGQSASDIDKRAIKQCEEIEIFKLNEWDYKYLKGIGLPGEKIKAQLTGAKEYSYIQIKNGEISLKKPI